MKMLDWNYLTGLKMTKDCFHIVGCCDIADGLETLCLKKILHCFCWAGVLCSSHCHICLTSLVLVDKQDAAALISVTGQ